MVAARRRRQADLHDRARLVLDHAPSARPAHWAGPEARRRRRADAGDLPPAGLPLPGAAAVLLRQGRDVVRAVQRRHQRPRRSTTSACSTSDFSPKPAFAAFEQESLHGDQLSGPCGDFSPPRITILHPTSGTRTTAARCRSRCAASSPRARRARDHDRALDQRSRLHFCSQGLRRRRCTQSRHVARARRTLPPGPHRIRVVVTDKLGNVATQDGLRRAHGVAPPRAPRRSAPLSSAAERGAARRPPLPACAVPARSPSTGAQPARSPTRRRGWRAPCRRLS